MCVKGMVTAGLAGLLIVSAALPASAYTFTIDSFEVIKNGNLLFFDDFNDGTPPASAPNFANNNPAGYTMLGAMGPESNGKLTLDSSTAALSTNAAGNQSLSQHAILQTNTQPPSVSQNGLKDDDTFRIRGLFDLIDPTQAREGYGIRLDDRWPGVHGPQEDNLRLDVRRDANGVLEIAFRRHDFVANTITLLDSAAVDLGHDQILLQFERLSASNDAITASYAYVDGGVIGGFTVFASTADIFHDEQFTRAGFQAFTGGVAAVPEPATAALFAAMLLLGARARRHAT